MITRYELFSIYLISRYQDPGETSESESFEECFGDHFLVFQYQEAKRESESFK